MNKQTQALDKLFEPILVKIYDMGQVGSDEWVVRRDTLLWAKGAILKACKEAGLKFVPDGFKLPKIDDAGTKCMGACNVTCHNIERKLAQKDTAFAILEQIKGIDIDE